MGVFQASMLEAMKSLLDEMHSMKIVPPLLCHKLDQVNNQTRTLGLQTRPLGHPTTRMVNQWIRIYMVLHFHQSSLKVSSPTTVPGTRIFNPTTQILNPGTTQNNLKGCIPKLRSTQTRKNARFGQSTILSPLSLSKSLLNLYRLLLSMRINRIQFPTARQICLTSPSQYAEEVEIFRQILELPDSRETLPRSSTTV